MIIYNQEKERKTKEKEIKIMLRDEIIYALFEEITANYTTLAAAELRVDALTYLTADEADCLREMLLDWFE